MPTVAQTSGSRCAVAMMSAHSLAARGDVEKALHAGFARARQHLVLLLDRPL
jgi:hypothetical protein